MTRGLKGKNPCKFNLSLSLYTVQQVSVLVEIGFHLVQVDLAAVRHVIYSSQVLGFPMSALSSKGNYI